MHEQIDDSDKSRTAFREDKRYASGYCYAWQGGYTFFCLRVNTYQCMKSCTSIPFALSPLPILSILCTRSHHQQPA